VAVYRDQAWLADWLPESIGALSGSRALTLFAKADEVWLGTDAGAFLRSPESAEPPVSVLYLPRLEVPR
jgi:hypothetical protein